MRLPLSLQTLEPGVLTTSESLEVVEPGLSDIGTAHLQSHDPTCPRP